MLRNDFHVATYEIRLKELLNAFASERDIGFFLNMFKHDPLIKVHEVGAALYSLLFFKYYQTVDEALLKLNITNQGTVCLFKNANFMWGALPYPAEHAELGSLLLQLSMHYEEYRNIATKMTVFQQASFTHKYEIFSSLFTQSITRSFKDINRAGHIFLSNSHTKFLQSYSFIDKEIAFTMLRDEQSSAYATGSGCKSSLGAFLFKDIGVVAFGPHKGSPENGDEFGISGRPHYFQFCNFDKNIKINFETTLSSSFKRETGFQFLKDSFFSLSRIRVNINFSLLKYLINIEFINSSKDESFFSIFCCAHICSIGRGPKLRAYSLDSYKGPVNDISLEGKNGEIMRIENIIGAKNMQIFSLPGDDTFWGANFLVLFNRSHDKIECCFNSKYNL